MKTTINYCRLLQVLAALCSLTTFVEIKRLWPLFLFCLIIICLVEWHIQSTLRWYKAKKREEYIKSVFNNGQFYKTSKN